MPTPREKRLVGTSLKMYFDLPSTTTYLTSLLTLSPLASSLNLDLFVIPTFLSLPSAHTLLSPTPVLLGAQNCSTDDRGPLTGEVSALSLSQSGVHFVEIGHAERRALFNETDADVARKAAAVVRHGMVPLVCVGEKSRGRDSAVASQTVGLAVEECWTQVKAALSGIAEADEVVLAYEPVWAIGAERPAEPDHVVAVTRALRERLRGRVGRVRILYGGSAGPGTFERVKEGVDGLFLGRYAHDIGNLEAVIREMGEV